MEVNDTQEPQTDGTEAPVVPAPPGAETSPLPAGPAAKSPFQRRLRTIGTILLIIALLSFCFGAYSLVQYYREKNWRPVESTIASYQTSYGGAKYSGGAPTYYDTLSYAVGNQKFTYADKTPRHSVPIIGNNLQLFYNPANPEQVDVNGQSDWLGGFIGPMIIGLLLLGVSIFCFKKSRRQASQQIS